MSGLSPGLKKRGDNMDPLEAMGVGAGIASATTGLFDSLTGASSARQYKYTRRLQKHQMEFNKMMSDTAVQRRVADLEAAGMNPILAINGGGAADSAGAQGGSIGMQDQQDTDFMSKAVSAQEYKRAKAETENLKSTTEQNESATAKNYADIANNEEITKAQVNLLLKEAGYKQSEIEYYNKWGVFPGATTTTGGSGSIIYGLASGSGTKTEPVGLKNNKTSAKKNKTIENARPDNVAKRKILNWLTN